jgi:hypothetical protein
MTKINLVFVAFFVLITHLSAQNSLFIKTQGFTNYTEFGLLVGSSDNKIPTGASISIFNGYQFNKHFACGFTTGLDKYEEWMLPIAFGFRGDVFKTKTTMYYSVDTGYSVHLAPKKSDDFEQDGGVMFNPALGLKVYGPKAAFIFSIGYRLQLAENRLKITDFRGEVYAMDKEQFTFHRLSLRFGLCF